MNYCPGCKGQTNCIVIESSGNRFKLECLECGQRFMDYVETMKVEVK